MNATPVAFGEDRLVKRTPVQPDGTVPARMIRKLLITAAVATLVASALPTFTLDAVAAKAYFKHPFAIALDRAGHLWVSNQDYFGVTEIQASTGKVIRVINNRADGFIDPTSIAVNGHDVWVVSGGVEYANGSSHVGTVTELSAANGALVRTVSLKDHEMTGLSGVSVDAKHVWVVADGGEKVAELSAATGRVIRVYRGRQKYVEICDIATDGRHVWITSPETGAGLVERSAVTGRQRRNISPTQVETPPMGGARGPVNLTPQFVAADGHYVWTGNQQGMTFKMSGSVTQIDAATGKIVHNVGTRADHFFSEIRDIASDGTHVWVVNGSDHTRYGRTGDTVTELSAVNGALIRVIRLRGGIYSDPFGIVSNGVDVWVTDNGGGRYGIGSVIEISASTGRIVRVIQG